MNTLKKTGQSYDNGSPKPMQPSAVFVALTLVLSGCSLLDRDEDTVQAEDISEVKVAAEPSAESAVESADSTETNPIYIEESSAPGTARVISPDAVTYTVSNDGSSTIAMPAADRMQEAHNSIKTEYPDAYTVVKGDTLWDISGKFLSKPWLWPEIWEVNPQIRNPHLIYPGDVVALRYIDGQPKMVVSRDGVVVDTRNRDSVYSNSDNYGQAGGSSNSSGSSLNGQSGARDQIVRLSPQIREVPLESAIPTIPGDAIQQFLVYPHVVDEDTASEAPYVLGNFEGRLASATGHQIYVRGDINKNQSQYGVFRKNQALKDPDTGEKLGFELTHVADAKLLHSGDPATMVITSSKMEAIAGDRILSQNQSLKVHNYVPRVPLIEGEGKIISLFNAITQSGRNQVVVVNMGKREGVRIGDVMAIEHRGGVIKDRFSGKPHDYIEVPNTRIGVMMIFHTFEKVSYGLIMESSRPIHKHDAVTGI